MSAIPNSSTLCMALMLSVVASNAPAQHYCLRPPEPTRLSVDPTADPELYEIVNQSYQRYLVDMETYINCIQDEHADAIAAVNEIIAEWREAFGEDAYLESDSKLGIAFY